MPIFNKDGTPYNLKKYNPLMINQEKIESTMILHNFCWKTINLNENKISKNVKVFKEEIPIVEEKPIKENVVVEKPSVKEVPIVEKSVEPEVENKNLVICYCLPCEFEKFEDDMYDESYSRKKYGKQFKFDALILGYDNFVMSFWYDKQITEGSIVYPSVYKSTNSKFRDYKWWKIKEANKKFKGFEYICVLSNEHPDFTDS